MVFNSPDHEIGDIGARDFKAEQWQMFFSHTVLPGVGFIGQLRWSHHRPIELALCKEPLHRCGVVDNLPKEQSAEQVGRRENGIPEQESHGFNHHPLDSGSVAWRWSARARNAGASVHPLWKSAPADQTPTRPHRGLESPAPGQRCRAGLLVLPSAGPGIFQGDPGSGPAQSANGRAPNPVE